MRGHGLVRPVPEVLAVGGLTHVRVDDPETGGGGGGGQSRWLLTKLHCIAVLEPAEEKSATTTYQAAAWQSSWRKVSASLASESTTLADSSIRAK